MAERGILFDRISWVFAKGLVCDAEMSESVLKSIES